jgi:hypothetical protein
MVIWKASEVAVKKLKLDKRNAENIKKAMMKEIAVLT